MAIKVLGVAEAEFLVPPEGTQDRLLLAAADTDGRLSLVEHQRRGNADRAA